MITSIIYSWSLFDKFLTFSPSLIVFTSCRRPSLLKSTAFESGEWRFFFRSPASSSAFLFWVLCLPSSLDSKYSDFLWKSLCLKDWRVASNVSQSTLDHCPSILFLKLLSLFLLSFFFWALIFACARPTSGTLVKASAKSVSNRLLNGLLIFK